MCSENVCLTGHEDSIFIFTHTHTHTHTHTERERERERERETHLCCHKDGALLELQEFVSQKSVRPSILTIQFSFFPRICRYLQDTMPAKAVLAGLQLPEIQKF